MKPPARDLPATGFRIVQLSAWLAFTLITFGLYHERTLQSWTSASLHLLDYGFGFGGSLLLLSILRRTRTRTTSFPGLAFALVAVSFVCSHCWIAAIESAAGIILRGTFSMAWITHMTFSTYAFRVFWTSLIYCGWGALYLFAMTRLDLQRQREQTLKAEALAKEAQVQMLRYQLNPHFLFNSLNAISALIEEDRGKAQDMIADLSEFLRFTLTGTTAAEAPLAHEMHMIRRYLAIEKKRFEEKLVIDYDIAPEAEPCLIPGFLIHPLVENAVKFGMRTSTMPLRIAVRARVRQGTLTVSVANSGHWVEPEVNSPSGTGTGLENMRKRLAASFPQAHTMEILKEADRVSILLELTARRSPH